MVTQIDSTCRITCITLWKGRRPNDNALAEVKSEKSIQQNGSSKEFVGSPTSIKMNTPLKPLLKRQSSSEKGVELVKTPSGPFIAEPIKRRDDKRPRLKFVDSSTAN